MSICMLTLHGNTQGMHPQAGKLADITYFPFNIAVNAFRCFFIALLPWLLCSWACTVSSPALSQPTQTLFQMAFIRKAAITWYICHASHCLCSESILSALSLWVEIPLSHYLPLLHAQPLLTQPAVEEPGQGVRLRKKLITWELTTVLGNRAGECWLNLSLSQDRCSR